MAPPLAPSLDPPPGLEGKKRNQTKQNDEEYGKYILIKKK